MTMSITATLRNGNAADIRAAGNIPAVVYAPQMETMSIALEASAFEKLYREAGESTIIELALDGQKEPMSVLVQDVQIDPVKGTALHVDFYKVTEGQELSADIELHFIGESPAVKQGGTLVMQRDSIDVTCLPKDLIDHIDVDISVLVEIGDSIHISDLAIPETITVSDDTELLVATVIAPRAAEEEESTEEMSIDDIQVEEKGKQEDSADEE